MRLRKRHANFDCFVSAVAGFFALSLVASCGGDATPSSDDSGRDAGTSRDAGTADGGQALDGGADGGTRTDGPELPPGPECDDGTRNGDETGSDCGGSCAPCPGETLVQEDGLVGHINVEYLGVSGWLVPGTLYRMSESHQCLGWIHPGPLPFQGADLGEMTVSGGPPFGWTVDRFDVDDLRNLYAGGPSDFESLPFDPSVRTILDVRTSGGALPAIDTSLFAPATWPRNWRDRTEEAPFSLTTFSNPLPDSLWVIRTDVDEDLRFTWTRPTTLGDGGDRARYFLVMVEMLNNPVPEGPIDFEGATEAGGLSCAFPLELGEGSIPRELLSALRSAILREGQTCGRIHVEMGDRVVVNPSEGSAVAVHVMSTSAFAFARNREYTPVKFCLN